MKRTFAALATRTEVATGECAAGGGPEVDQADTTISLAAYRSVPSVVSVGAAASRRRLPRRLAPWRDRAADRD